MEPDMIIHPAIIMNEWDIIILKQPNDTSDYQEKLTVKENVYGRLICSMEDGRIVWLSFGFYQLFEDWHFEPIYIQGAY